MFYDVIRNDHGLQIDPFKALIAPRPIGWISTQSADGVANLAPYSFYNAFATSPHYVAFGSEGYKDSLRNIEATGVFACNLATFDLRDAMNASSAHVPTHVDEFELTGLTKIPCVMIDAPRVGESPACFECRHFKTVELPDEQGQVANWLVIGRVVAVHIDDRFIANGRVNTAAMQPIARLGYVEYATVDKAWRIQRPN